MAVGAEGLSPREVEVLQLVARGHTNAEVAERLGISPLTVKKHLERMYETVGARNRADLVARVQRPRDSALASDAAGLPAPLTSFIGRERELAEVTVLVQRTRLVTLGGPGGIGKTRLAIEIAGSVAGARRDGVRLVDLAPLSDQRLIAQQIASVLGVADRGGSRMRALTGALRGKDVLLVLDNCEHLRSAVAAAASEILRACASVRILATSREALGMAGEAYWQVPPLSLPDPTRSRLPELARSEAVRLFIERARLRVPAFDLTTENAGAVVAVCRALDGMPLAIELAAARMHALSVDELAKRLDDRFGELRTDAPDVTPRHRTLRGVVEWSYRLLAPAEAALFDRLSIFRGGSTLDAIVAVCADDVVGADRVLDLIGRLIDKSFVVADLARARTRYRMLETLRHFGHERLVARAEVGQLRRRHADFYRALAEEAEPHLKSGAQREWSERLDDEHDNIREALRWSLDREPVIALRIAGAMWRYWFHRGHTREGLEWLGRALTAESPRDLAYAKALNGAGNLVHALGDRARAEALHRQCLELRRALRDPHGIVQSLSNLGDRVRERRAFAEARALYDEAVRVATELGDAWGLAIVLAGIGHIALAQGDPVEAERWYHRAYGWMRRSGDRTRAGHVIGNIADALMQQRRYARAADLYRRNLVIFRAFGDRIGMLDSVAFLGAAAALSGDHRRAARLLGAAEAAREVVGGRFWPPRDAVFDQGARAVRAALDPATLSELRGHGRDLTLEQATEVALAATQA